MHIQGTRQGTLRVNLPGIAQYYSFNLAPLESVLPLKLDDEDISALVLASRKLGELEGMSRFVPNADMYLTMYVRKEAVLSSQIEGTQCTFDDVLDPSVDESLFADVADVVNYVDAAEYAMREMGRMPLCIRLLRNVHSRLLSGVRGADKQPGTIRTSQNWIGPAGCTIQTATFVPPNVDDMHRSLSELEVFMNAADVDPVVRAALVHYQFETIHPFLDGNGRLGRLLITLSLVNDGVLSSSLFYPSYELKLRRSEYYQRLYAVRECGEYEQWVRFFCECLISGATNAQRSLIRLVSLHNENTKIIRSALGRNSARGLELLDFLEAHPIATVSMVCDALSVSRTTATGLVDQFIRAGILIDADASRQRYKKYAYEPYLSILRSGVEPYVR